MAVSIPFPTSQSNVTLAVPIEDQEVLFDLRWNSRDQAWYADMYESDDTIICLNIKIVLGVNLGRRSQHEFFDTYKIVVIDTTNSGTDAGFDDLNSRVLLVVQSINDVV
jgi:hypothetical protein